MYLPNQNFNIKHYFYIPFLWLGPKIYKLKSQGGWKAVEAWVRERYLLMKQTAISSLLNQTHPSPILVGVGNLFSSMIKDIMDENPLPPPGSLCYRKLD